MQTKPNDAGNDQATTEVIGANGDNLATGDNLRNYILSRDRAKREIVPPSIFAHANVIAYAFNISDTI